MTLREILCLGPVIPVVTIDDADHGVPLARALLAGGIRVVEVTLRTPAALEACRKIAAEVAKITLGVGTVLDPDQVNPVAATGAAFAVSPGLDPRVVSFCKAHSLPILPGIQTVSEAMAARRLGLDTLKFFPAKAAGGPDALKQMQPVLPDLVFCPTGGIGEGDAPAYLALDNVLCIGGSFPAPTAMIRAGDWTGITALAKKAQGLNA